MSESAGKQQIEDMNDNLCRAMECDQVDEDGIKTRIKCI